MHPRNTSLLILSLLLLNSCEDPTRAYPSLHPMIHAADSVWLRAESDGVAWSPADSAGNFFSFYFYQETNKLSLLALNINPSTDKGPGISIEIDSVIGSGVYAATLAGPARATYTSTGDGHPDKGGKAFDGAVVLDVLDTSVTQGNASPRIHGTFEMRFLQTLPAPDTFTISGEFEGLWH